MKNNFRIEDNIESTISLYSTYIKKTNVLHKAGVDVDSLVSELESLLDILLRDCYGEKVANEIIDYVNRDSNSREDIKYFVEYLRGWSEGVTH